MPKESRPRRGSLQFYPRKRAKRIYPRIKTYPKLEKLGLLAFAGYKVGMAHVVVMDNNKNSPTYGKEIVIPVTILDCPPLKVVGLRFYTKDSRGLKPLTEVWAKNLPKDIQRKIKTLKSGNEEKLSEVEKQLDKIVKIRAIVATQPRLAGIRKKKLEVFEVEIGRKDIKEIFDFAKGILGKDVKVDEVFREGELIDVIGVTRGFGTEGPVRRFGITIQTRKATQKRRHVGSLGSEGLGRVLWTVPMAGQMGFFTRTEINKRIVKIGTDGREINPKGGFKRYGLISSNYMLIAGSTPGPKKRLIIVRPAIRPGKKPRFMPLEVREVIVSENS